MTAGRILFEVRGSIHDAEARVLRAGAVGTELLALDAVADVVGAEDNGLAAVARSFWAVMAEADVAGAKGHGCGGAIFLGWDG
jgi:hypothetical protein